MRRPTEKLLIITYYWPPSGGPGVQRWLKNTNYLVRHGMQAFVLTVDEKRASYFQIDHSLEGEIDPQVKVYKTGSFEILNFYRRFTKSGRLPTSGFSNAGKASLAQRITTAIRSNFFIPDPRRGWNGYAFQKAKSLIKDHGIDTVLTTSPPHSSQLIGLKLKKKLGIRWIADFRDPWTDIYYYKDLGHSGISAMLDRRFEKSVLDHADHILTIGHGLKKLFLSKQEGIEDKKISVITNGYDAEDFSMPVDKLDTGNFTIVYTGTMSDNYQPEVFFKAAKKMIEKCPEPIIKIKLIGVFSAGILSMLEKIGLMPHVELIPPVPHREAITHMQRSNALLLVIPKYPDDHLIITGKLFEYLATGRPIICIGPTDGDAAAIIKECSAGKTFDRHAEPTIVDYLTSLIDKPDQGRSDKQRKMAARYSREQQTLNFIEILKNRML
jgi:glycosyltransferase involved in cell wall biosynthesis